jgi:membrane protein
VIAKKLARVIPDAVQHFYADHCPQQAAGIAYRVLFSIAPLAIVLVSIFGLVLQSDSIRQDVVNAIVDALPVSVAGRKDVENAITAIATPASAAGLVSLFVFVWAATGMMTALRQGLETAMGVTESRPAVRGKLVDLVLIVGAAALVLVTVGITLLGSLVQRASGSLGELLGVGAGTLAAVLIRAASFVLSIVVVLLLYRFVPARGLRVRDGVAGAIVTALLLLLISLASGVIYERTTNLSVVYGSLTAALVFLYSMYLYSSALLLGAEVAAAWARPPTENGEPILTQVKRGVLGLFVKQKVAPANPPPHDRTSDKRTSRGE